MKFSNFLFPQSEIPEKDGQVIDETLAEARLCDELGMEALWLAEHHFDGNCAYVDPVNFAAASLGLLLTCRADSIWHRLGGRNQRPKDTARTRRIGHTSGLLDRSLESAPPELASTNHAIPGFPVCVPSCDMVE